MGTVVIGAPEFDSFHLLDRLQRELTQRGHRMHTLCCEDATADFWRLQGLAAHQLVPAAADAMRAPLREFAELQATANGLRHGSAARRRCVSRTERELNRLLPACVRWFETERPDLLLLPGARGAHSQMLHFVARELGVRVLWLGRGLLPHTLQHDELGRDGDAAITHRVAGDYRDAPQQPALLGSCLAHLLGRAEPAALSRRELRRPPWRNQVEGAWRAARRGSWHEVARCWSGWHAALPPIVSSAVQNFELPRAPFATVLLQDADDPAVCLDATGAPDATQLVAAARTATAAIDRGIGLAVVLPPRGLHHRQLATLAADPGVHLLPAVAAIDAAATALATFTINHPLAVTAMLTGTPVLHCGRALYGLGGVTHRGPSAGFVDVLGPALAADADTLRERLLTVLLGQDHVWCSPSHPDHNGLIGLANTIEERLGSRSPQGARPGHRTGPPWPLAAPLE